MRQHNSAYTSCRRKCAARAVRCGPDTSLPGTLGMSHSASCPSCTSTVLNFLSSHLYRTPGRSVPAEYSDNCLSPSYLLANCTRTPLGRSWASLPTTPLCRCSHPIHTSTAATTSQSPTCSQSGSSPHKPRQIRRRHSRHWMWCLSMAPYSCTSQVCKSDWCPTTNPKSNK